MIDPDSRYAELPLASHRTRDGSTPDEREIPYVTRRFLPRADALSMLGTVTVKDGDRLDLIASRVIGDPLQYWRICDANEAMDPVDLTCPIGRALHIATPVPQRS